MKGFVEGMDWGFKGIWKNLTGLQEMKILKGFEGSWIKKGRDGKYIGRERRLLEDEQL